MADADVSSNKSRESLPADYSSFISKIERRLWVLHSQLQATNALVQAESGYDESDSLASVSFLLSEMANNADQVIDLLGDGGLAYDTDSVRNKFTGQVQ